ncbi:hypothetical protein HYW21_04150 [Candidatus Woesearchaeota archaeon]|nr:hypothetical protein [Candidatus Woesearchaeota archaeon]
MGGMKYNLVIVSLALLILVIGTVSAVSVKDVKDIFSVSKQRVLGEQGKPWLMTEQECGALPTDGCVVTQNTTFQPGVFDLPNGIRIEANNIFLDCNNALLQGFNGGYYGRDNYGIRLDGYHNVAIKNCNLSSYSYPIYLKNAYSLTVSNNSFFGVQHGWPGPFIMGNNITHSTFSFNHNDFGDFASQFTRNFSSNIISNNTFRGYFVVNDGTGKGNLFEQNTFLYNGVVGINSYADTFQHNNFSASTRLHGRDSRITDNTFSSEINVSGTESHFYDNLIYGYVPFDVVYENVYYCYEDRENMYFGPQGPGCSSDYSPEISSLEANYITSVSARITWDTEIHATSRLSYGTSPDNFTSQAFSDNYVTSHYLDAHNLTQRTTYYYRARSCTILNCTESELGNFTTLASPYEPDNKTFEGTGYIEAWGVGNVTVAGTTFGVPNGRVEVDGNGTLTVLGNASVLDIHGFENMTIIPGGYQYTGDGTALVKGENITVTMSGTVDGFYAKGIGMVTLAGTGGYRKGKSPSIIFNGTVTKSMGYEG